MTFKKSIESFMNSYTSYSSHDGRTSRSEFWLSYLYINILLSVIVLIIDSIFTNEYQIVGYIVKFIFIVLLLIPLIDLSIKRLHDTNKSGWYILLYLTIIGLIPLLVWFIKKGDESDNKYGSPS